MSIFNTGKIEAVLSIAGYDPSGGAGVLADIKTFESLGKHGCAICTCITFQNDIAFHGLNWLEFETIKNQFNSLSTRFEFKTAKIGLIKNIQMLNECIEMLKDYSSEIKIIWDPILKASAGFEFHEKFDAKLLYESLKKIYLVTPNLEESKQLFPNGLDDAIAITNLLIKDCEVTEPNAVDNLFEDGHWHTISEKRITGFEKHGSGCVLSAAISAYVSNENTSLMQACKEAKLYTLNFLKSSPQRVGFHKN